MVDVLKLAGYLLYLNRKEAELDDDEAASDITPMKLQKLLYYCQGYSLGLTGRPLFHDDIEAWQYGPVVRIVYKEYQKYKGACLPLDLVKSPPSVDEYVAGVAAMVMRDKGGYSAVALSKATHREPAWREAWEKEMNCALSLETITDYFSGILNEELPPEEEDRFWKSVGREPTRKEWEEIALSL